MLRRQLTFHHTPCNRPGLVALVALLTSSPLAWPDSQPAGDEEALLRLYGDEQMISIATGYRQPIAEAPAVATVITAEDIKAIGATDLDEVLETVPGLHVARDPLGYDPIYTFRGIYATFNPQVLVLINGIPLTNLFHGDRNLVWGGMPVEGIERIEVMRGPGSALYGADAFAGVINVITKTRQDIKRNQAGIRYGSFDTKDAWLEYGNSLGGFDLAFVLEYHDTNGQREKIDADAQSAFDNILGTSASHASGPVNLSRENVDAYLDVGRGHWRLRGGLQRRRNGGDGAGLAQALDPGGRAESDRWRGDLTYHNPNFADDWDVKVQASYLNTTQEISRDLRLFPPGAVLPIGPDGNINPVTPAGLVAFPDGVIAKPEVWERHARIGTSAFYKGFPRHVIGGGLGFNYSDIYKVREHKNFGPGVIDGTTSPIDGKLTDVSGTPFVFLPEDDRKDYYFFMQDVWGFANDWELTSGVRYDRYSDFGDTINPRLALVWSARHNLTAKLLYGQGFRAPSFAETRNQNNPVDLGNPDLDPETIDSLEVSLDYRPTPTLTGVLSLFRYWWDDIILLVPDPGTTTRTAQNAGKQKGYGLELDLSWTPTRNLRLLGNYAYQKSTDEHSNQDAGNAPQHQLYARAEWEFLPDWKLSPQVNWVGARERPPGDNRSDIDDYTTVDLTLRRRNIKHRFEFAFSVRNLFNVHAREPSPPGAPVTPIPNDLPLAGRNVYGELRYFF